MRFYPPWVGLSDSVEKDQATSKWRRSVVVALVLVLLLALAAAIAPFTPLMPVKSINVEGTTLLLHEEVEAATQIAPETPMARVDVQAAARNVAQNPWVKSVTVTRDWPSSVRVSVNEREPVAFYHDSDGPHLIDREGTAFVIAEPPAGAVELVGVVPENTEAMQAAVDIAVAIGDHVRGEVAAIEARGPFTFALRLVDGRRVIWGASTDNMNKAYALESAMELEGEEFNISNPGLITSR